YRRQNRTQTQNCNEKRNCGKQREEMNYNKNTTEMHKETEQTLQNNQFWWDRIFTKAQCAFLFTAIGVQGQFVQLPAPSSVSITGRTYHHILPANIPNHSIHWYLYDEQE
ncbi:29481_t:CDS:2, partial [Gigaspora margarita]